MKRVPENHHKQILASGEWLQLANLTFTDGRGRKRKWEAAERVDGNGAVLIIARLKRTNRLVLVKQYRPPSGKFIIEFPAGLIDDGETPEQTAARELFEETGYHGKIIFTSPPAYNSPGMSGETVVTVIAEVDDGLFDIHPPESQQEDSEEIETILVEQDEIHEFLDHAVASGWGVDSKVVAFAAAIAHKGSVS